MFVLIDDVLLEAKKYTPEEQLEYVYDKYTPAYWEKKREFFNDEPRSGDIKGIIRSLRRRNGRDFAQFREQRDFINVYELKFLEAIFWNDVLVEAGKKWREKAEIRRKENREKWLKSQGFENETEYLISLGWTKTSYGVLIKPQVERETELPQVLQPTFHIESYNKANRQGYRGKRKDG